MNKLILICLFLILPIGLVYAHSGAQIESGCHDTKPPCQQPSIIKD